MSAARIAVARAPLRIDLTGGFTDVPPFSQGIRPLHVNAALRLGVRVHCRVIDEPGVRVRFAADISDAASAVAPGRTRFVHALAATMKTLAMGHGLGLSIVSDAPAGSGLGSSGAILVAAMMGGAQLAGMTLAPGEAARRAIEAARAADVIGGEQDEFAAAYGSLRAYEFGLSPASVDLSSPDAVRYLQERLLIVRFGHTGRRTDVVSEIAQDVQRGRAEVIRALEELQELAHEMRDMVGSAELDRFPLLIARIRDVQSRLHPEIRCPAVETSMEKVRTQLPGTEYKMLGGGGAGSCVLVVVPAQKKQLVKSLLRAHGAWVVDVRVQHHGAVAEIIE